MVKLLFVFVIGAGGVGKAFLEQLERLRRSYSNLRLAAITTTKRSVAYTDIGLSEAQQDWLEFDDGQQQPSLDVNAILKLAKGIPSGSRAVVVDNTSSQGVADAYPLFLRNGISIVTPNKKAFSAGWRLWTDIQASAWAPHKPFGGLIYHESSCGAGLPVISTINDLVRTGDEITKIQGVFSGTMSFLFNSFAPVSGEGGQWSAEVAKAKDLGYTEPDPRDDLNGLDVARKLVILARLAGLKVEDTSSFAVQSLIPKELESCSSGDEFLEKLPQFDGQMASVKMDAGKQGKVVRFVGSIDVPKKELKVGLEQFATDHPIAGLKGADNIISFHTTRYSDTPLIIQGAGAGANVTAMGVTSDLIKVLERVDALS